MSIDELNKRKGDYPKDRETLADLGSAIAHHRYHISQKYKELAEIQLKFEQLNMDAAERRARKARRQE